MSDTYSITGSWFGHSISTGEQGSPTAACFAAAIPEFGLGSSSWTLSVSGTDCVATYAGVPQATLPITTNTGGASTSSPTESLPTMTLADAQIIGFSLAGVLAVAGVFKLIASVFDGAFEE